MVETEKTGEKVLKILIVDDEETIRYVLKNFLQVGGYEVKTADSGATAFPVIEEFQPHVVLLDVRMPDMDGLQCLRLIKENNPAIDVLMMSGFATDQIAKKSLELGAFDYMNKPLNLENLVKLLELIKITKFSGNT